MLLRCLRRGGGDGSRPAAERQRGLARAGDTAPVTAPGYPHSTWRSDTGATDPSPAREAAGEGSACGFLTLSRGRGATPDSTRDSGTAPRLRPALGQAGEDGERAGDGHRHRETSSLPPAQRPAPHRSSSLSPAPARPRSARRPRAHGGHPRPHACVPPHTAAARPSGAPRARRLPPATVPYRGAPPPTGRAPPSPRAPGEEGESPTRRLSAAPPHQAESSRQGESFPSAVDGGGPCPGEAGGRWGAAERPGEPGRRRAARPSGGDPRPLQASLPRRHDHVVDNQVGRGQGARALPPPRLLAAVAVIRPAAAAARRRHVAALPRPPPALSARRDGGAGPLHLPRRRRRRHFGGGQSAVGSRRPSRLAVRGAGGKEGAPVSAAPRGALRVRAGPSGARGGELGNVERERRQIVGALPLTARAGRPAGRPGLASAGADKRPYRSRFNNQKNRLKMPLCGLTPAGRNRSVISLGKLIALVFKVRLFQEYLVGFHHLNGLTSCWSRAPPEL